MDGLAIRREDATALRDYGRVPIAFTVESRLRIDGIAAGANLVAKPVETPFVKDYDAIRGEGPAHWAGRFDLANWMVLSAFLGYRRVGGAVVAWNTERVDMLEGRTDLACLWDLRVHPDLRGRGIGTALLGEAVRWSRERACRVLKVETQDINVPACRFYAARGFRLRSVRPGAYPELPEETMLLWYLALPGPDAEGTSGR
jgi:GNAT superfamily N-acetyltransferase